MAATTYPVGIEFDATPAMARWRPLVQWFLAIPHAIVQQALGAVTVVVAAISWFAILFTGRLPDGLARFSVMSMRYSARFLAYAGFLHTQYPPFDFTTSNEDPGGQPVRLAATPALEDRNRLTVGLRFIWAIPAAVFGMIILFAAYVVWLVAAIAVLVTGEWPEGMRSFVTRALGVWVRVTAYVLLLTDEYPPFELD